MKYFISDLHLEHNKEFIYKPRGFKTVNEMNETLLTNINNIVAPEDELYLLGDSVLGGNIKPSIIKSIICHNIKMILGNHDTPKRIEYYNNYKNIEVLGYATQIEYQGFKLYLCHYPTLITPISEAPLKDKIINVFGHTHQTGKFYLDNPWMYCVCADAHNNMPVSIDELLNDCAKQWAICNSEL